MKLLVLKVALAQMEVNLSNPKKNLDKAKAFIQRAYEQNATIICFPEGFLIDLYNRKMLYRFAEEIPGNFVTFFSRLAEEYHLYIVMGTIPEKNDEKVYNTSVLISSSGEVLGKYRKICLWHDEKPYTQRGEDLPIFKTKIGIIGIQICWDIVYPDIARTLVKKGADIIFSPSFWKDGDNPFIYKYKEPIEARFINALCKARAWENQVPFVFVNASGKFIRDDISDVLTGSSQITVPFYGSIAHLDKEETVLSKEINFDVVKDAKRAYRVMGDIPKIKHILNHIQ